MTRTKKNEQTVTLHLVQERREAARCHHPSKQNGDEPTVEEASHMQQAGHSWTATSLEPCEWFYYFHQSMFRYFCHPHCNSHQNLQPGHKFSGSRIQIKTSHAGQLLNIKYSHNDQFDSMSKKCFAMAQVRNEDELKTEINGADHNHCEVNLIKWHQTECSFSRTWGSSNCISCHAPVFFFCLLPFPVSVCISICMGMCERGCWVDSHNDK